MLDVYREGAALAAAAAGAESSRSGAASAGGDTGSDAGSAFDETASVMSRSSGRFAEWEADWAAGGAATSRALYALGQLACISSLRVQQMIVPQLLGLAVAVIPAACAGGPWERSLPQPAWLAQAPIDGPDRGLFTLRGAPHSRERSTSAAILETLGRVATIKATAGDSAAVDALIQHSPESLAIFADLLHTPSPSPLQRSAPQAAAGLSQERPDRAASWLTGDDDALTPFSPLPPPVTPATPLSPSALALEPPLLLVPTLAYLLLDSVRGAAPGREGRDDPPLLFASLSQGEPSLHGLMSASGLPRGWRSDPLPLRVGRAAELVFRSVSIRASPAVQDGLRAAVVRTVLCSSTPPAVVAEGARLRAAVKLVLRAEFERLALGAATPPPSERSADLAPKPASQLDAADVAAAVARLSEGGPVLLAPSPWYAPCAAADVPSPSAPERAAIDAQLLILPAFLVSLMCSRRGAPPLPDASALASGLGALCLLVPGGDIVSCDDPLAKKSGAGARSDSNAGIIEAGDDGVTPIPASGGGDPGRRLFASPAAASSWGAGAIAPHRPPPPRHQAALGRVAVLCAQAIGIVFNRAPVAPGAVEGVAELLSPFLSFIQQATGIRCELPPQPGGSGAAARVGSALPTTPSVEVEGAPRAAAAPPAPAGAVPPPAPLPVPGLHPIRAPSDPVTAPQHPHPLLLERLPPTPGGAVFLTHARQRGVLLLVWLCKGLAQRGHPLVDVVLRALVSVVSGGGVLWEDVSPPPPELVALAGRGLGTVVSDAAPRHPFSREAGAAVAVLYKQRIFQTVFAAYRRLLHAPSGSTLGSSPVGSGGDSRESVSPRDAAADDAALDPAQPAAGSGGGGSGQPNTTADVRQPLTPNEVGRHRRVVPLLLSLCAIATHLPQAVMLADIDNVLPVVLRALELATFRDSRAAGVASAQSDDESGSSGSSPSQDAADAAARLFKPLRDAVISSALLCLHTLIGNACAIVGTHLHALVPILLALAQRSSGLDSRPLVRATAVDCLRGFTTLPYHKLHPVRQTVLAGLAPVLDDPKRAVRRRAAACRNEWTTLASGAAGK